LRGELEQLCQELGIADAVAMPGYDSNPYRYMAKADLFVLASAWEGCPIALQEAMAAGAAVIVTDAPGGMKDVIEFGKHGRMVPTGDPNALAAEILHLLDQPELRKHYREQAQQRAGDFHYLNTAQQYIDLYQSVLSSPVK
jgi:glycosyltransferase involved in cell wall biosynthesis